MEKFLPLLISLLAVLIMVAFFTLFERKFLGILQTRSGPSKVGFWGLLQPFSDMLKLVTKTTPSPGKGLPAGYLLGPFGMLILSGLVFAFLPFKFSKENEFSAVTVLMVLSVSSFPLIISGWFSRSKYSVLGSLRSVSQHISFEIPLSTSIISIVILNQTSSIHEILIHSGVWVSFFCPTLPVLMTLSLSAEASRLPFDLPESESELVSGYSIEYGGAMFTIIFLAEACSLLLLSGLFSSLLSGSISPPLSLSLLFLAVWARGVLPRVRYDLMMEVCWVELVPMALSTLWLCAMALCTS
uniref:NADH-ubiquinone oxidoreductase chain 1 n=1 Tax=Polyplax asiatica TaxID=1425297 RepID=V9PXD5_9NEOP|nr:NADH dehydrogenase subunit 1 [Polyplax asiatica]